MSKSIAPQRPSHKSFVSRLNAYRRRKRTQQLMVVGILAGLCGLPIVLSQMFLVGQSLRLDESQSIWQASHSITGVLRVVAQDVHVPLYHVLLHYWMLVFGNGVEAVRSLSLLFFVLTLPVAYCLARMVMGRRWALVTVLLLATSPFLNWYANEARMYTLLLCVATLSQYYFAKILRNNTGWKGYALTAVIGVYSHYFFAFNLLAQALFYVFNHRAFVAGSLKRFIAVGCAVVLALVPWITYFLSQGAASNTRPLIKPPTSVDFFNVYSQFLFGYHSDAVNTILVSLWPLLVVVAFMIVKRNLVFGKHVGFLLTSAIVPVVVAFGLSFVVSPFFLSRYMMPSVVALIIATVWLLSRYQKTVSYPLAFSLLLIFVAGFASQVTNLDTPVREDYRQAAAYVSSKATSSDIVVLSSPFTVYPFEYYYDGRAQIKTLPLWDRSSVGAIPGYDSSKLTSQVDALKKDHQYLYLLLSYDQGYEKEVQQYFDRNLERAEVKTFSHDMTLYTYRVGYYTVPSLYDHPIR